MSVLSIPRSIVRSIPRSIVRGGDGGSAPPAPLFAVGTKLATLGDSIIAQGYGSTTAAVRTTMLARCYNATTWLQSMHPAFKHDAWWEPTATAANDIPTYGVGSAVDNLFRGANFGYSGDTTLGITRRTQQVIDSGAEICYINVGTNTDVPNTAVNKIALLDQAITALVAGNVHCVVSTIRPRWQGEDFALNNALSTENGSPIVSVACTGHTITAPQLIKAIQFLPAVTIGGITLSGIITSGSGGYTITFVDANNFTITTPGNATSTVAGGGGATTLYVNNYTDGSGAVQNGLGLLPADPRNVVHKDTNDWILTQAGRTGVTVVDLSDMRDTTRAAATGVYLAAKRENTYDGVHSSHIGAYAEALLVKPVYDALIAPGTWFNPDPLVSNLSLNGRLTGTGGIANNGCSGVMPTASFFSNVSGAGQPVTGVASVEANADTGGQSSVLVCTSTGLGGAGVTNELRFSQTNATVGFLSTDWFSAYLEVEFSGITDTVLAAFRLTAGQTTTASNVVFEPTGSLIARPYPQHNGTLWLRTPPLLVEARTSLGAILRLTVKADLAGSFTVKVKRVIYRLVTDPETEFPWVP